MNKLSSDDKTVIWMTLKPKMGVVYEGKDYFDGDRCECNKFHATCCVRQGKASRTKPAPKKAAPVKTGKE